MNLADAIAVFDKSADRTKPNAQTEAWAVIRAELMRVPVADSAKLANGYTVERHAREIVEGHYPNHREYMVAAAYLALRARVEAAEVVRWAQIAREGTPSDWQQETADLRKFFADITNANGS